MSLKKVPVNKKWQKPPCLSKGHNPPMHISLQPGDYEWTCEACGTVIPFHVAGVYYMSETAPRLSVYPSSTNQTHLTLVS